MGGRQRATLKLVEPDDPRGAPAQGAPHADEPGFALKCALVALFIALVAGGLSYGFFDWAPFWVHLAVAGAAFVSMVVFGPRMACGG